MKKMENKTGIELIAEERQKQIEKHKWTKQHDQQEHYNKELLLAALFALTGEIRYSQVGFEKFEYKISHKDYKEQLVIAGALIAAEIDRFQNA